MAQYDDLNGKRIFIVGILSVVVVIVTALAVQVLYFGLVQMQEEAKSQATNYRRQNEVLSKQADEISSYGVDPDTGKITIPIDAAIKKIAGEKKTPSTDTSASQSKDKKANEA